MHQPVLVLGILGLNIFVSEWLCRNTALRHAGTALTVIVITAIVANIGIIPSASNAPPLYSAIFEYIAPIGIFFLLLEVNLTQLARAGMPMLIMFLIGSAATFIGVVAALAIIDGAAAFGEFAPAIGGMFVGTYTGGAVNFNAVALEYKVVEETALYTGALAVDNIMTSVWMIATLALPAVLNRWIPRAASVSRVSMNENERLRHEHDTETINPGDIALLAGLGLAAFWISGLIKNALAQAGIVMPFILVLSTLALILAQSKRFNGITGSRILGMLLVYLFLAVIGAHAEIGTLIELGKLGALIFIFVTLIITIHGLITFAAGAMLKIDWSIVAIASQANIGGSTSALALARSIGRSDLMLPAILAGSLGNGLGTYLGFIAAGWLGA